MHSVDQTTFVRVVNPTYLFRTAQPTTLTMCTKRLLSALLCQVNWMV